MRFPDPPGAVICWKTTTFRSGERETPGGGEVCVAKTLTNNFVANNLALLFFQFPSRCQGHSLVFVVT